MSSHLPNLIGPIPADLLVPDVVGAVDRQRKDCTDLYRAYIHFSGEGDQARAEAALNALNARNCLPCPPVTECPPIPECPPQKDCPKPGSSLWWIIAVLVGATILLAEPDTGK
mgnify:FL=1